jgi:integrase/recombinase XerD
MTINALLKKDRKLADGAFPVYLCIFINNKRYYISLQRMDQQLFGFKDSWDNQRGCFNKQKKNHKHHNATIEDSIDKAKKIIKEQNQGNGIDFNAFRISFFGIVNQTKKLKELLYLNNQKHINQKKFKTAEVYSTAINSFLKTIKKENIEAKDIDKKVLKHFENLLFKNNNKDSTVHNYIRTIKALLNKSVDENLIKPEDNKIKDYSLAHIKPQANKRSLSQTDLNKIINSKFSEKNLELARLSFLFSIYTCGMNFADLCLLKSDNIYDNEIKYTRLKTGKNLNIPFISQAKFILQEIKRNYEWKNKTYIFPYINEEIHNTPKKIRTRLDTSRAKFNSDLKKIADNLKINFNLTSYVCRHTFSVTAYHNKESMTNISSLLGHTTERTTITYLESLTSNHLSGIESFLPPITIKNQ